MTSSNHYTSPRPDIEHHIADLTSTAVVLEMIRVRDKEKFSPELSWVLDRVARHIEELRLAFHGPAA